MSKPIPPCTSDYYPMAAQGHARQEALEEAAKEVEAIDRHGDRECNCVDLAAAAIRARAKV